jgi:hypothetical protein
VTTAFVLHPDGEFEKLDLPTKGTLHEMYRALGCSCVDVVSLTANLDMWIDDEGLLTGRPLNPAATALARHYGYTSQPYVGPVLLCGVDDDGNSVNLQHAQAVALLTRLLDIANAASEPIGSEGKPVQYTVTVLHNVTRTPEGRTAIFDRDDTRCLPGDVLRQVGTLTITADTPAAALEAVYEAGNAPFDTPQVREYRSWRVRSLCAGDVLEVQPGGLVLACEPMGWVQMARGVFEYEDTAAATPSPSAPVEAAGAALAPDDE